MSPSTALAEPVFGGEFSIGLKRGNFLTAFEEFVGVAPMRRFNERVGRFSKYERNNGAYVGVQYRRQFLIVVAVGIFNT
jgi:hypothetical protein